MGMSIAHPPRPQRDTRPSRPTLHTAPDEQQIAAFRHRALLFEVVDHEAAPTVLAVLTAGSALLIGLVAATGGIAATAEGTPPLLAWLAGLSLVAALLVGASEALAWLIAHRVGRTVARAVCALEDSRAAVERLVPVHLVSEEDEELQLAARRVDHAITCVIGRLADADTALLAFARIADPVTREGRLGLLREEAWSVHAAAEAVDATAHLLRWIEACPWSAARPDALKLLRTDLAAAERLLTDGVLR
jgi:hypothetical protein